jgi:hypothetical protein
MPVHPRQMAATSEGKVWEAIADLKRELRQQRRTTALQSQKFFNVYDAGGPGAPSPQVLAPAFTPNIPDSDGWNCYFHMYWRQIAISDATSTWEFGVRDVDPNSNVFDTTVSTMANFNGQFSAETIQPATTAFGVSIAQQDILFKLNNARTTLAPGDHSIKPYAKRTAGTASTILWAYCYFFAVIL